MAVNKVIYNIDNEEHVLVDLTNDTVTSENLIEGITAHTSSGEIITGSLIVQTYYTGDSEPDNSLGNNGDLYLKI